MREIEARFVIVSNRGLAEMNHLGLTRQSSFPHETRECDLEGGMPSQAGSPTSSDGIARCFSLLSDALPRGMNYSATRHLKRW